MRATSILSLTIAAALSGVLAAQAQDLLTQADPDIVLNAAKGFGSATLEKDSGGDPMVSGRIDGLKYAIYFYGCKDGANCRSIQFSSGYTDAWSVAKANEWNTKFRWIKAYEKDGSNFKMDVDFKGGVSKQFLDEQFITWQSFIQDMKDSAASQ